MKALHFITLALGVALMTSAALAQQTELRITHATTGGAEKEVMDAIVAAFEAANPDVKVKQIPFDDDIYSNTALITQLQGQDVPDIYFQWAGFPVKRDVGAGYAMDLTEALATDGWGDTFVPAIWTEGSGTMVDGKPYMIPISLDVTNTIWYNKAIFEKNGVVPPATWAEFVALVDKLNKAGEIPIIQGNNEFWPFGNWASHIAIYLADASTTYVLLFRSSWGAARIERSGVATSGSPTDRRKASSGGSESSPRGSSSRSAGPAMNVVAIAISTSIVKRLVEMRPSSRPMLSTISSVRPRVFISAPSAVESRQLKPLNRAASIAPTHLPTTATTKRTSATTQQLPAVERADLHPSAP